MDYKLMLASSVLAGLLSTMNVWAIDRRHVKFHLNDVYMAALMTAWMFVWMFAWTAAGRRRGWQAVLVLLGIAGAAVALVLAAIRKQLFVDDRQYLKGMIPHHSMAILMSRRILERTKDPALRRLAQQIVRSQTAEIAEMAQMLEGTKR